MQAKTLLAGLGAEELRTGPRGPEGVGACPPPSRSLSALALPSRHAAGQSSVTAQEEAVDGNTISSERGRKQGPWEPRASRRAGGASV